MSTAHELIEMMTSAGVDIDEAERRARSYIADRDAESQLSKSLDYLDEVAAIQADAEERHIERLNKARSQGESSIAEHLAPALDDLLREQRAQNEAICKGLTGVLDLIKNLRSEMRGFREVSASSRRQPLSKSLDIVPSPHEEINHSSRDDLFKALADTVAERPERAAELMQAAALVEGGADPAEIAQRFNLNRG